MKVALVCETAGGGSGRHVVDLARGLRAAGVTPRIVYSTRRAEPGFAGAAASATGAPAVVVDLHLGPNSPRNWRRLDRWLRRWSPDVVHAHSSLAGVFARTLPRPAWAAVYTPHALKSMDPSLAWARRRAVAAIEGRLGRRSDRIIAVSEDEANHMAAIGIDRRRVSVVVNGIDPVRGDRGAERAALGLGAHDVVVGWVGRMAHQKDPLAFVDWCDRARHSSAFTAVMIGEGDLLADVRRAIARRGLTQTVLTPGGRDGQRAMAAMDLLCLSSRYEAMPYVLIEAAHAGLPIIATPTGGATEVVRAGENGAVVHDPAAAAAAISALVSDAPRRAACGEASRARAATLTLDTMVKQTIEVYESVLAAR